MAVNSKLASEALEAVTGHRRPRRCWSFEQSRKKYLLPSTGEIWETGLTSLKFRDFEAALAGEEKIKRPGDSGSRLRELRDSA